MTTQLSSLATLCASASSPSMVTAHSLVKCPAEATAANSGSKYNDRIFDLRFFNNTKRQQNQSCDDHSKNLLAGCTCSSATVLAPNSSRFSLSNNTHNINT